MNSNQLSLVWQGGFIGKLETSPHCPHLYKFKDSTNSTKNPGPAKNKNPSDNVYLDVKNVKSEDAIGKESAKKKLLAWHSDSCLVTKSASIIWEGNCHDCDVQSGNRTFSKCGQ
jgi:hypothetical protein